MIKAKYYTKGFDRPITDRPIVETFELKSKLQALRVILNKYPKADIHYIKKIN
jgi:hypothetical protein